MKIQILIAIDLLFSLSWLSACGSKQPLNPTLPPTHLPTPTLTQIPPLQPTTSAISSISMNCDDWALVKSGNYTAQNNTWGKGSISDWSQCIGIEINEDGTLAGRWTWDWLSLGSNVKAYPEIIFGQKPGSATTSTDLPRKINELGEVMISYDVSSSHTGSGNVAFDIWLTDTQNPDTWDVPPITHEIMIWLDSYGGMMPGGNFMERVDIDDTLYNVFVGENYGQGWRYIAFGRVTSQLGVGTLNLKSFLSYLLDKNLVTGDEYLASIEFGNEVIGGSGETLLNMYTISITHLAPVQSDVEKTGEFIQKLYESENGGTIPYVFRIPKDIKKDQLYPLLVFLHGAGERGTDNTSQLIGFPHNFINTQNQKDYPMYIIAPQCPPSDAWASFPNYPNSAQTSENPTNATRLTIELIEKLLLDYNIDRNRVYVMGLSLGGEGAFDIVSRRPDLIAAAVPICGIADVEKVSSMKNVPFWVFHGEKDDINPVEYSRSIVQALQALGASPIYTEYKDAGHGIWNRVYNEPELLSWLFSQKK